MTDSRPEVLEIIPHYLPGFKAGGPIRTVSATVERLFDEFCFRILTSDRDVGDDAPYPGVTSDKWIKRGAAEVMYLSPENRGFVALRRLFDSLTPDLVHVNGFYHPGFTFWPLLLRRLGMLSNVPLLLAPRGHLSPGARSLKPWRKRVYIGLIKVLGLNRGVVFHASEELERREIRAIFPDSEVRVAADPSPHPTRGMATANASGREVGTPIELSKRPGELRALFLSRIVPKKNLAGLLDALSGVRGDVTLTIVGPIGDEAYWRDCRRKIRTLPGSITVDYRGSVSPDEVLDVMGEHHLFVLPTRSENFGHVIREALEAGRPVLISDQTPWEDVEQASAGWICRVESTECFRDRIEEALRMDQDAFDSMCFSARRYVAEVLEERSAADRTRELFRKMLAHGGA